MAVTQRLRFEIFKRDNYTCRYCGITRDDGAKLTIDHVVPVALGGTDEPSNLVTACRPCNSGKSSVPPDADLVAQVAADAFRFASALERVTADRRQAIRDMAANVAWFDQAWANWTWTDRDGEEHALDRDGDWQVSIERFFTAGLDRSDLGHCLTRAMTNRAARNPWRMFCRYAWDEIKMRQEDARLAMTAPEASSAEEPDDAGYADGYDAGFHDGSAYGESQERSRIASEIDSAYERGFRDGVARARLSPGDDDMRTVF